MSTSLQNKRSQSKKYALCIGMQAVNHGHYLKLKKYGSACYNATYISVVLEQQGFAVKKWQNEEAQSKKFIRQIQSWGRTMHKGDLLVLSFSGHGAKIMSNDNEIDDWEKEDEGWCMYDRVLFFFELWELARAFRPGVKIIVLSDACYSGPLGFDTKAMRFRPGRRFSFFNIQKDVYNPILNAALRPLYHTIPPAVLVLSASAENGKAFERPGKRHSEFTIALKKAFKSKNTRDYYSFFESIMETILKRNQTVTNPGEKQHPRWFYCQGHLNTYLPKKSVF